MTTSLKSLVAKRRRRGATTLEFALVIIMFLLTVLGMVEISRAVMVRQVLVNAAREATRRAVVPGATVAEVTGILNNYALGSHMGGTWTPKYYVNGTEEPDLTSANSHDEIAVSVEVPFSDVSWGLMRYVSNSTLAAQVTMRKE